MSSSSYGTEVDEQYYKGFSTFRRVSNPSLKSYNQTITYLNIWRDVGSKIAKEYFSYLPADDKPGVSEMFSKFKQNGINSVKKDVLKSIV